MFREGGVAKTEKRVILHCDLNNFFASVSLLFNPTLRSVPVAVCGDKEQRHGIVLAKNEAAKRCGVKTAEAIFEAKAKCPELVILPPMMDKYKEYSEKAHRIYEEYTDMEYIIPMDGRYPEHDNEVMISLRRSRTYGLNVGDTIVIDNKGVKTSYIITGIVGAMSNNQMNLYMTLDGFQRANGSAAPGCVEIYLEDGVNREEFESKLISIYGQSVDTAMSGDNAGGTLEERIQAEASEKIAVLMSTYGVTSVDYAVRVGDQLITGNSRQFVMKELQSYHDLVKSQLDPISNITRLFTGVGAVAIGVIVAVILGIIASSNVMKRRKDLGIMKSLGYSSKDLMTQIAISIIPVTVVSVILASAASIIINKVFWFQVFGADIKTSIPVLILTDLALIAFTFVMTYIGAGKIRKISVNELMTE